MIDLDREGDVFVLRMDAEENRFSPGFMNEVNEALDQVEGASSPVAVVITGSGKFFSNGLDLEWMMAHPDETNAHLKEVLTLIARVLTFPAITIAAINGHAFGAGGQLAVAHDFRVMRSERGYFCMPEVDMRIPLHPAMTALLQARVPASTLHKVIVTGKRWGGEAAAAAGIVDEVVPVEDLLPRAREIAAELTSKASPALAKLKRDLYPEVFLALEKPLE